MKLSVQLSSFGLYIVEPAKRSARKQVYWRRQSGAANVVFAQAAADSTRQRMHGFRPAHARTSHGMRAYEQAINVSTASVTPIDRTQIFHEQCS